MTKEEKIKLEELKFIKQQEHFIEQKINIIAVVVGIVISAVFVFFVQKYDTLSLEKKIWFFVLTIISLIFVLIMIFPKFINRGKKDKDSLYSKKYQNWDVDLLTSLNSQLEIARDLFKNKVFYCRLVIFLESCCFLE